MPNPNGNLLIDLIPEEKDLKERFGKLGIGNNKTYDLDNFDEEFQKAIKKGVIEGFTEIENFIKEYNTDPLMSAKIFGTRKFLKQSAKDNFHMDDFYIMRAAAAHLVFMVIQDQRHSTRRISMIRLDCCLMHRNIIIHFREKSAPAGKSRLNTGFQSCHYCFQSLG